MNRLTSYLTALILTVGLAAVGVSAQNFAPEGTVVKTPNQHQIAKRIRYLSHYSVFDVINFKVDGSTVVLTGKVASLGTKSAASTAIKGLPGVTKVVNNIEQLPASPFDDRIRREAIRTFINRGPAQYFSEIDPAVRIIVENGNVTLVGTVARKSDSDLLNVLANGLTGVFSVTNNIVVEAKAR
ncbi:MAG: BON domain-containing protein [Acidobacteria bacterium]|nr:BON domain-containing protein [Acidobacteriota bacterium]